MAKITLEVGYIDCLKYFSNASWNAVAVRVDDTGITPNPYGRKIVPHGTVVGGNTQPVLTNRHEPVIAKNTADAEGVLLRDVDVTDGPADGAMVVEGFIDLAKMPTPPDTAAIEALKRITFMN